jgi:hypothetical protein
MPTISHRPLVGTLTYRAIALPVRERGANSGLLVPSTGYSDTELKSAKFQPEYAAKLNFYVALGRVSLIPLVAQMSC